MGEYTMEDWLQMERELTRERGLWGPPVGSDLDKWMLDMTEGFSHTLSLLRLSLEMLLLSLPSHRGGSVAEWLACMLD